MNLSALKRTAEAADQHPWRWWVKDGEHVLMGGLGGDTELLRVSHPPVTRPATICDDPQQLFIATFSPPVVLILLARIAELEAAQ